MERTGEKRAGESKVEEGCPLRDICPKRWHDFTSIGTNGEKMDKDCPMRVAIRLGVYNEETTAFIREVLARAKGYDK